MLKKIFSGELEKGVLILFIAINILNILNYLFHFVMGRILTPSDYGVLAVLMSILNIYNVPTEAIQNIISRYTSKFNLKKEKGKMKFLMFKSLKRGLKIAIPIFIISIFIAFPLSNFLDINVNLIIISNIFIFYSFLGPITKGILQGRKKFGLLGLNLVLEAFLKLFFGVSLVVFGFKVLGAIGGVLFGVLSGIIFSFYFNKDLLKSKEEKVSFKAPYSKSVSYFVVMFVVLLALGIDIILAKRFFSAEIAGKYAVISMISKIIFFATVAISKAMFPLTSEKYEKKENSIKLFKKSIIITGIFGFIGVILFMLIPESIIKILYGSNYIEMAPFLIYLGISFTFLSLTNLNLIYGLSTKGIKRSFYLFIFLAIEIIILFLYHNSILEYVMGFMVSNIIMFIGSFFFIRFRN